MSKRDDQNDFIGGVLMVIGCCVVAAIVVLWMFGVVKF